MHSLCKKVNLTLKEIVRTVAARLAPIWNGKWRFWRRGIVVIASASRTEDPGFEFRQGVRYLCLRTLQWCCQNLIYSSWHRVFLRKINVYKKSYFWIILLYMQRTICKLNWTLVTYIPVLQSPCQRICTDLQAYTELKMWADSSNPTCNTYEIEIFDTLSRWPRKTAVSKPFKVCIILIENDCVIIIEN
jgi:hypothetical protein